VATSVPTPSFGFCVPPFANPGAAFFRTPAWTALEPTLAVDAVVEAERLGYDSIWMADHLVHGHDGGILEGWTTLCVAAGRTSRIKLGTIHLAQPFRHPAVMAKMAATLDALSGGRLILFYDCGWGEAEVRMYGLPWPDEAERIARMDEGIRLMDELWRAEAPIDFRGDYFHTEQAICRPKPVQLPRPPIWLGEARHDAWCDVVARHAEGWNSTPASVPRLREKIARVEAACGRIGRDPAGLELSLEVQILVAPTEAEARAKLREIAALPPSPRGRRRDDLVAFVESDDQRPLGDVVDDWLIGTPDAVAARIREYQAIGVSHFMLWFVDFPSLDGLRLFAEAVAPRLR
jgi:alkanesulfonate monooxygenase SsuD/methylene tetrahydromethanopterin reductase-like flavin-dependent oxidoreductase (luciferase family)